MNTLITKVLGVATGGRPLNIFTTLARHRRLFRRWLVFAGGLMPGGVLPRQETELVILRVAHNTGSEYEWRQHERLARTAGLSSEEVRRVREGPGAAEWSVRQRLLLEATDELHIDRVISSSVWEGLRPQMSDAELIELSMLVGHYEMVAMTLASLGVEPDPTPTGPAGPLDRALQALLARRAAFGARR